MPEYEPVTVWLAGDGAAGGIALRESGETFRVSISELGKMCMVRAFSGIVRSIIINFCYNIYLLFFSHKRVREFIFYY